MLTYGSLVWAKATESKGVKQKLESLQRLALTSMGCFRRSTPTAGLEVITYTTPLWLFVRQEAAMAYIRTMHLEKIPREKLQTEKRPKAIGHRQYMKTFLEKIQYEIEASDQSGEALDNWQKQYKLNTDSYKEGTPEWDGDIFVYTDGSKDTEGKTGAGAVIYDCDKKIIISNKWHLGRFATVFQAEVYAIMQAANMLRDKEYTNKKIVVHSDSRAALQAIDGNNVTSTIVGNAISSLNIIDPSNTVELRWIKGHADHMGNEEADRLAKDGAADENNVVQDIPSVSANILRDRLRGAIDAEWQRDWDEEQPCRQTKHFFPYISKKQSILATKCNRKTFSIYTQFVTGHNWLNRHNAIVEHGFPDTAESACPHCGGEESSLHIFAECPMYNDARLAVLHEISPLTPPFLTTPSVVIAFLKEASIECFTEQLL